MNMNRFVVIDYYNGVNFVIDSNGVYEGAQARSEIDMGVIIENNPDSYIIILFDEYKIFVRRLSYRVEIKDEQMLDWMDVVWGGEKECVDVTLFLSEQELKRFRYGKNMMLGRGKEIVIGDNIPLIYDEMYSRKEFYEKVIDRIKAKYGELLQPKEDERKRNPIEDKMDRILANMEEINKKLTQQEFYRQNTSADSGKNDKMERSLNYIISLLENTPTESNSENDALIQELKNELGEYKVDFYFKAMRKQGVDAMIEILEFLYSYIESLDEYQKPILLKVMERVERTLRDRLNVRCAISEIGTPFDGNTMICYPGDFLTTQDEFKHNTVARSVRPAFYWTMPMVNGNEREFLFKEEVVILYKYEE